MNKRSEPERKLISLPLTDDQHEALKSHIHTPWGVFEGAVFIVMSCSYDPSAGRQVAKMACACLPRKDAGRVIDMIRGFFGLPAFLRSVRRKRTNGKG